MTNNIGRRRRRSTTATRTSSLSCLFLLALSTSSSSSNFFVDAASGADLPIGAAVPPPPSTSTSASSSISTTASTTTSGSSDSSHSSKSSLLSTPSSSSMSTSSSSSRVRISSILRKFLTPPSSIRSHVAEKGGTPTSIRLLLKSISLHSIRLLLAIYIAQTTYNILKEIWDDVQSELVSAQQKRGGFGMGSSRSGGGGSEDDVREEQDMPYCSSLDGSLSLGEYLFGEDDDHDNDDDENDDGEGKNDIDDDYDNDEEDSSYAIHDSRKLPLRKQTRRSDSSRRQPRSRDETDDDYDDSSISALQQLTPQMAATRELAHRLHSAGLPYASEMKRNGGRRAGRSTSTTTTTTVEDILQSLTRAEGNVLSQTLLSPLDDRTTVGKDEAEEGSGMVSAAAAAWNAIGGLSDAKESLLDLAFPLLPTSTTQSNNNDDDHYYGGLLSNPPGVLLYGPPGCGKGLLVRALASTIHARFLIVSPSVLLRKYVGETNLNVRALFSVARKLSPTVIFVDELDGLFRERGGEDHDVGRDLKTEFLQLWDGIRNHRVYGGSGGGASSSSSSSILVIGATNRPFDVDPAFLRRMPRKIYVGLPDYDSRISVLQGMLRRVPLDVDFDVALVATKTEGYSPSDIREVLQTAALFPLREARAEAIRNSSATSSSASVDGETGNYAEKKVGMMPTMPPLRRLRTEDVLRALDISRPTHFSRKYRKELMNYIRNSGAINPQREMDRDDHPPPSVVDASENYYPDSSSPREDGSNQQLQEEADISSYDEDSDSDYDDL